MSEPIWCTIEFRAPVSWNLGDEPPPFVQQAAEALLNGSGPDNVVWMENVDGKTVEVEHPDCWQLNGEGNYGLNDDEVEAVLGWCDEHRVPYIAMSDAKYEMTGELVIFDGTENWQRFARDESGPILQLAYWQTIYNDRIGSVDGDHEIVTAVADYFRRATVNIWDLDISHLPGEYPTDEVDE